MNYQNAATTRHFTSALSGSTWFRQNRADPRRCVADVDIQNAKGETPMILATKHKYKRIIKSLLVYKINQSYFFKLCSSKLIQSSVLTTTVNRGFTPLTSRDIHSRDIELAKMFLDCHYDAQLKIKDSMD